MSANTAPIFIGTPKNAFASTGVNANTALDGTGTVVTVYTAGANGSKIETINLWNIGSNIGTVVRFFINNGSTNTTAANNALIQEISWATNTVSQVASSTPVIIQPNIYLPASYKLNVTIGTAIASGIMVNAQGGDF